MITFKQFLREKEEHPLKTLIENDCAEFLRESKREGFLVRGMENAFRRGKVHSFPNPEGPNTHPVEFLEREVRTNRRPLDNTPKMHDLLDKWFVDKFGFPARSGSLFCFGSSERGRRNAAGYGSLYLIFPIGDFKYVWSPKVFDLFLFTGGLSIESSSEDEDEKNRKAHFYEMLESFSYTNKELETAITLGNEMMIHCNSYYAFPDRYHDTLADLLGIDKQ